MSPASLVLDLVERVWNGGDLRALPEYFADPFEHDNGTGTLAELLAWHQEEAQAWAGTTYAVLDCVAAADAVALRWRASSTQVGPWGSVQSTGRRFEWVGAHFFRVEDGRIVAMHALVDRFGKAMQLGVRVTPPGAPPDDPGAGPGADPGNDEGAGR
jgi:predicted ester cyclase